MVCGLLPADTTGGLRCLAGGPAFTVVCDDRFTNYDVGTMLCATGAVMPAVAEIGVGVDDLARWRGAEAGDRQARAGCAIWIDHRVVAQGERRIGRSG